MAKQKNDAAGAGDQNQPVTAEGKKAKYICIHPVKHNGKRHDTEIELTPEEAEPLLAIGHIEPA